MEVDADKVRMLAESAERRAREHHAKYEENRYHSKAPSYLNDFFYWSGKATSYRGIIAMAELQTIVDDELDAEGSCP